MMARYYFETQADMIDELVKAVSPKHLAGYLYHNYNGYSLDLQWELDTERLDNLFDGFDSYEEFAEHQGQQRFDFTE